MSKPEEAETPGLPEGIDQASDQIEIDLSEAEEADDRSGICLGWDRSHEWEMSRPDRPFLTWHAQQRWDERTPWWSRSIEYAYNCGVPVFEFRDIVFRSSDENDPDQVRVFGENTEHGKYGVMLFIEEKSLVTVYPIDRAFLSKPVKAYLWCLLDQQGHLELDSEPHEGVQND